MAARAILQVSFTEGVRALWAVNRLFLRRPHWNSLWKDVVAVLDALFPGEWSPLTYYLVGPPARRLKLAIVEWRCQIKRRRWKQALLMPSSKRIQIE